MKDGFSATLEARDPSLGRMRSCRFEAGEADTSPPLQLFMT
jgi:hypothetical protein